MLVSENPLVWDLELFRQTKLSQMRNILAS